MSPDDIGAVVQRAVRGGLYFPWWTYILAFFFSVVGAYVGSYVKRKGEDQAAQANFDNLREQLRKTTQDTEEIKTKLLGKNWLTQQHWAIREQHYMNLLAHLTKLKLSLQDRASYCMEPGSEQDSTRSQGEQFQKLARIGHKSYQAIRELIGPASVFLSAKAIASLEQLVHDHWSVAEFSQCTADYLSEALKLVAVAQSAVLVEAKAELAQSQPDT